MKEYSEMFDWYYDIEASVRIVNWKQICYYVFKNVKMVDTFYSNGSLVCVFDKASSQDAYRKWCNHDLEIDFLNQTKSN